MPFNHPEGQAHPRPPTHLKRVKRYDFGEFIAPLPEKLIQNYIGDRRFFSESKSLAGKLRDFIYDKDQRSGYVDFAQNYLITKKMDINIDYDLILVGAGIHAATYLYTLRKTNPDIKILIVEKTSMICSTFCKLGDSLVLNSPTFSKVSLNSNIIQGHFIQTSDFDELAERPFPTAKHLYELAAMVMFHCDADIVFNFEVEDIIKEGELYSLTSGETNVRGKKILIANGMGEPKKDSFEKDKLSEKIILGDDFIEYCLEDKNFINYVKGKRVAVVGNGDTANCVMEYLLPLVYPNYYYGFYRNSSFLPKFVFWLGQDAKTIQDYYFSNKTRYCHSGGVIEFFWDEETPFELSTEIWKKTKELIKCIPDKLVSLSHIGDSLELTTNQDAIKADLVIDCTGRSNKLASMVKSKDYEFVKGDISFFGGHWDDALDRFVVKERKLHSRNLACKIKNEEIYLLGTACPMHELICDDEAKNGSAKYQEDRTSLTNSKWSLEHTLPRTVAFAEKL